MHRSIWSRAREDENVDIAIGAVAVPVLIVLLLICFVALGAGSAQAAPAPASGDQRTVEVFWSMPSYEGGAEDVPTAETATWPQLHSPAGAVECGVWYQVDTYTKAEAKRFTRDGILEHGEDHGAAISWRFVYGGDCDPEPPVLPEPEFRTTSTEAPPSCEHATVTITTVNETRGAYVGEDNEVHWGEWAEVDRVVTTRELTADEEATCRGNQPDPLIEVGEWEGGVPDCVDPTVEQTRAVTTTVSVPAGTGWVPGEPTVVIETRTVSLSEGEVATCNPVTDPEPTPEPTPPVTPAPPVEPTPSPEPPTPTTSTQRIITPDVPVLAETGTSDAKAGFLLAGLTLILLGAVMVAVHRIRGRR